MTISSAMAYFDMSVICLWLLYRYTRNTIKYSTHAIERNPFLYAIMATAVCAFFEAFYCLLKCGFLSGTTLNYVTEMGRSISSTFAAYFWFLSSEREQGAATVKTKCRMWLLSIPLFVVIILNLTTPWLHLAFYFDGDTYVRGPWKLWMCIAPLALMIKTGLCALFRSMNKVYYLKRRDYFHYYLFALVAMVSFGLQEIWPFVLPFRVIGATLVLSVVQESLIKSKISTDTLTGVNNRAAIEKYFSTYYSAADATFTYVIVDLDSFKQINDQYGHGAGDFALQLTARAFLDILPKNIMFARFGGDEFVLMENKETTDWPSLMEQIQNHLNQLTEEENVPWRCIFSYGIAHKKDGRTIPELMECADQVMYQMKEQYKKEHH